MKLLTCTTTRQYLGDTQYYRMSQFHGTVGIHIRAEPISAQYTPTPRSNCILWRYLPRESSMSQRDVLLLLMSYLFPSVCASLLQLLLERVPPDEVHSPDPRLTSYRHDIAYFCFLLFAVVRPPLPKLRTTEAFPWLCLVDVSLPFLLLSSLLFTPLFPFLPLLFSHRFVSPLLLSNHRVLGFFY